MERYVSQLMRLMVDINGQGLHNASRSREEFITPN
jgi:hypothetical protein